MNNFDVMIDEIRDRLFKECESCALDNADDLEAVMKVITRVIQEHYNKTLTSAYQYIAHHPV
tara:strand:- start:93 stop:278 length:186 start_codon:yes stop_codon:yes gene_type:complete